VSFSVVYLIARRLLGYLMVLARREASKDAEILLRRVDGVADPQGRRDRPGAPPGRPWVGGVPGQRSLMSAELRRFHRCPNAIVVFFPLSGGYWVVTRDRRLPGQIRVAWLMAG
jgi:hypothetical protein